MRRFLVVVLAGCWGSAPAPSVENRAAAPSKPFAAISGSWRGNGYQPDNDSTWSIEMTLHADAAVGEQVGTIAYPSLRCRGVLTRVASDANELRAHEKITVNPTVDGTPQCADDGIIVLPLAPGPEGLDWKWYYPDGKLGANATLYR